MKQTSIITAVFKLALLGVVGLQVSCSSSSSSDDTVDTTMISGYVVAAPVTGAQVKIVDGNGNEVAGPVPTDGSGKYTLNIPSSSLAQDLILKSSGGTFTDEATGNGGTAGEMFAYASANSLVEGGTVCATPGSSIVADLVMNHNKSMTEAQEVFTKAFGYTPDTSIHPEDATGPAADASDESKLAGFRAAVFSQLANNLGLSQDDQFAMFAALAKDLSDDVLDGVDVSGAVDVGATGVTLRADIQNQFEVALIGFHGSDNNLSGLNNAQIGNLPFSKLASTASYDIEYVVTGMGTMEGKSSFQIKVMDPDTGVGVAGVTPMLMPMMYMSDHKHSTPKLSCVAGAAAGDYDCTVYYLMASQMMDGTSMGYWDLKFTVDTEIAHFYPAVMMAMGDTPKVKLQAQAAGTDKIMTMNGEMARKYFVFKDGLSGMGDNRTFTMFVAAIETMMSYPAVSVDTVLSADTAFVLTANPMTVEVSTDDGGSWILADDNGNGNWSADGVTGLVDGAAGMINVRLTINGEVKTTNGYAPGEDINGDPLAVDAISNEYSIFTVTPGGM